MEHLYLLRVLATFRRFFSDPSFLIVFWCPTKKGQTLAPFFMETQTNYSNWKGRIQTQFCVISETSLNDLFKTSHMVWPEHFLWKLMEQNTKSCEILRQIDESAKKEKSYRWGRGEANHDQLPILDSNSTNFSQENPFSPSWFSWRVICSIYTSQPLFSVFPYPHGLRVDLSD